MIVALVVLLVGFLFMCEIYVQIYIQYRKSPPNVDCEQVRLMHTFQQLKVMAMYEYLFI